MRLVAISDVHGKWKKLKIPTCDILISAGDYSFKGEPHMVKDFHAWLEVQDAGHIISVQGNHELWVEKNFQEAKELAESVCPAVHFIDEGLVEIEGLKIWCSAITPWFHDWAWNRHRGPEIKSHWDRIPDDTNIIVTHGPAYGILDLVVAANGDPQRNVGCVQLGKRIKEIKPDIHICGHIHSGHGEFEQDGIRYFNASICDEMYYPSYPITEIILHGNKLR